MKMQRIREGIGVLAISAAWASIVFSSIYTPLVLHRNSIVLEEIRATDKAHDAAVDLIETRLYTIMTAYVHQCHYLGRHKVATYGCPLCFKFVEDQRKEVTGTSDVDKIINESNGPEDMSKKLKEHFDKKD